VGLFLLMAGSPSCDEELEPHTNSEPGARAVGGSSDSGACVVLSVRAPVQLEAAALVMALKRCRKTNIVTISGLVGPRFAEAECHYCGIRQDMACRPACIIFA